MPPRIDAPLLDEISRHVLPFHTAKFERKPDHRGPGQLFIEPYALNSKSPFAAHPTHSFVKIEDPQWRHRTMAEQPSKFLRQLLLFSKQVLHPRQVRTFLVFDELVRPDERRKALEQLLKRLYPVLGVLECCQAPCSHLETSQHQFEEKSFKTVAQPILNPRQRGVLDHSDGSHLLFEKAEIDDRLARLARTEAQRSSKKHKKKPEPPRDIDGDLEAKSEGIARRAQQLNHRSDTTATHYDKLLTTSLTSAIDV